MKVNGEQIQLTKATTLEEFLKEQGYNIQRIAIERNDEIVPRENFSDVMPVYYTHLTLPKILRV